MRPKRSVPIVAFLLLAASVAWCQPGRPAAMDDPCGFSDTTSASYRLAAATNWGYGYDSLLADIGRWRQSPFVHLDSIGTSVQGRPLYVLTIEDTALVPQPRTTIWIHARTHPAEVQGTWVTNAMIRELLANTPQAQTLREACVFSILPMYNPDGVELSLARQNANGIDIESNWDDVPGEVEVQALRAHFEELMVQANPIRVALNMHSSVSCTRYFVAHAATWTSVAYLELQQQFIGAVRNAFPGGIEPWTYFVSWVGGAPTVYPESWFWYHHGEDVLALTYEDMNCPDAGNFDSTAHALLQGIGEFVGALPVTAVAEVNGHLPEGFSLAQNYPNPFNPTTTISFRLPEAQFVVLTLYDLLGREVARPLEDWKQAGEHHVRLDAGGLATGTYVYRLVAGEFHSSRRLVLIR